MRDILILGFAALLYPAFVFAHDHIAKYLYCEWKHKHPNGYKCYYWSCKHYNDCPFNGTKRRFKIPRFKRTR